MSKTVFAFNPASLDHNITQLCEHNGRAKPDDVASRWKRIAITPRGEDTVSFDVVGGKYISALLIDYLSEIHGSQRVNLTNEDKQMVRDYFGPELVSDALNNPETKHTTIKALLSDEPVLVILIRA